VSNHRPDLSKAQILLLDASIAAVAAIILLTPYSPAPASPAGQLAAAGGALLLLAPLLFVIMKRSGASASPPAWFIVHVLASLVGSCLILVHAKAGDWLSPPGLLLLFLVLLLVQGSLLRAVLSRGFSWLFARNSEASGFGAPAALDKAALQSLIERKVRMLRDLDPGADEALFSPALQHWLKKPWLSLRYQLLAEREARMVGARAAADRVLAWSRRLHMTIALGFYLGLLAHVVVVLFFAGYAAGGGPVDWWYITAWGG